MRGCVDVVKVCWPVGFKVSPPSAPSDVVVAGTPCCSLLCLGAEDLNSHSAGTLARNWNQPAPCSLPFKLLEMHFLKAQLGRAPWWEASLLPWQLATSQALLLTVPTSFHSVKHVCYVFYIIVVFLNGFVFFLVNLHHLLLADLLA